MKDVTRYSRKMRVWFIQSVIYICVLWIFFMPNFQKVNTGTDDRYVVELDGVKVGVVSEPDMAKECLRAARRNIAAGNDELVLANAEIKVTGEKVLFGRVSSMEDVTSAMNQVLQENLHSTLNRSYTVKIKDFSVNLSSKDEVLSLLKASIRKYDPESQYDVNLIMDPSREVNALTTSVVSQEEEARKRNVRLRFRKRELNL